MSTTLTDALAYGVIALMLVHDDREDAKDEVERQRRKSEESN
jgi:hypothetical protein